MGYGEKCIGLNKITTTRAHNRTSNRTTKKARNILSMYGKTIVYLSGMRFQFNTDEDIFIHVQRPIVCWH